MKYGMIAIDLDGTLLRNDKTISDRNLQVLRKANECGLHAVITTGRAWPGAKRFAAQLGLDNPVITSNGAMIVNPVTEEPIRNTILCPKDACTILDMGRKRLTSQIIWSNNILYGLPVDERLHDYGRRYGCMTPMPAPDREVLLRQGISKILWYDERETVNGWKQEVLATEFESVTVCTSEPCFLEFFNKKVSKAKAIETVGAMFGLTLSQIAAVGDAGNDIPMLRAAGLGVAMGNADEEVLAIADAVTGDNEHDGVADLVERLLMDESSI